MHITIQITEVLLSLLLVSHLILDRPHIIFKSSQFCCNWLKK